MFNATSILSGTIAIAKAPINIGTTEILAFYTL